MLIYDNEYETKENENWTKDKTKLQHVHPLNCCVNNTDSLDAWKKSSRDALARNLYDYGK